MLPGIDAATASADVAPVQYQLSYSGCYQHKACSFDVRTPDTTSVVTITVNGTAVASGAPQLVAPAQPGYSPAYADYTATWTPTSSGVYTVTATQGSNTATWKFAVCPTPPYSGSGGFTDSPFPPPVDTTGPVLGSVENGPYNLCNQLGLLATQSGIPTGSTLPLFSLSG
ncbi:hypothetical protein EBN03_12120 [Nocardia stercoris]|uniref:Uncharacterized protein n=1 Tax=Nocardia stercoris TaxID=2483361 RepID=A0A3M2L4T7_9NOCA|nr:hypothetical protein EBN03_12120 [Nocardia stercoris]